MRRTTNLVLLAVLALALSLSAGAAGEPETATRLDGAIRMDHVYYPVCVDERGDMLEPVVYRGAVYIPLATAAEWLGGTWTLEGTALRLTSGETPQVRGLDQQPERYAPALQAMIHTCPVEADQRAKAVPYPELTVELDGTAHPLVNVRGEATPAIECLGTLYLPIRSVGELMGQRVVWTRHGSGSGDHVIYLTAPPSAQEWAELEQYAGAMAGLCDPLTERLAELRAEWAGLAEEAGMARLEELEGLLTRMAALDQPTAGFGAFYRRLTLTHVDSAREDTAFLRSRLVGQTVCDGLSLDVLQEHVDHIAQDVTFLQADLAALKAEG